MQSERAPHVVVRAELDEERSSIITLVIENIGKSVAFGVGFTLSRPIPEYAWGVSVDEASSKTFANMQSGPLFSGIPALGVGERRVLNWGQYGGLRAALGEGVVQCNASYRDSGGRQHGSTSILDICSFEGVDCTTRPHVKLADNIERIAKTLDHVATGFSKPQVITQTLEEHRKMQAEFVERAQLRRTNSAETKTIESK